MNHIYYIYIIKYRAVHNIGISLDARYLYNMDEKQKSLSIMPNPHYVDGIWPTGISSLSAIVGNNGAGKTTCLEAFLQILADGSGEFSPEAIILYGNQQSLRAYIPKKCEYNIQNERIHISQDRPTTGLFYYSSYFRPYTSLHAPGDGELAGVYNATDTWRLVKDLQDYSNIDTNSANNSLAWHLNAHIAQDHSRIIQLMSDDELRKLLPESLPDHILVVQNTSGYYLLLHKKQTQKEYKNLDLRVPFFNRSFEGCLANIILYVFYNVAADYGRTPEEAFEILSYKDEWLALYQESKQAEFSLEQFIKGRIRNEIRFVQLLNVIKYLKSACKYNKNANTLCLRFGDNQDKNSIKHLLGFYQNRNFIVAHFFDMVYAYDSYSGARLSSGEMDMLKFYSRLYDALSLYPTKFDNIYAPSLLLVDEAENSYHPEWQRQFVCRLVDFLQALYNRKKYSFEFQVVLTTHSPILLSDIPRMCVNYLEKNDKTGETRLSIDQPETFGSNVFELYRNAFFMQDGLVGKYAQKKIIEIIQEIRESIKSIDEILSEIELIGDKAIKDYLHSLLEGRNKESMLLYYRQKVKELEGKSYAAD